MKVVLFDIGNVLVNFDFEDLKKAIAEASGRSVYEPTEKDEQMYFAAETGKLGEEDYVECLNRACGLDWRVQNLVDVWMDLFTINETGYGLFRELIDRGEPVYTLSNIAGYHIRAIEANWPGFFDGASELFLSYQIGFRKPESGIYRHALKRVGASPEHCFFMDDLPENIEAARVEGIRANHFVPKTYASVREELDRFLTS
jgi:putative hydrolase of the HAD superfamily